MRVAIDGRTIVPDRSGIGTYAHHITRSLLRVDPHNEYVLFQVADVPDLDAPNLTKVTIEGYNRMILNRWWENVLLPNYLSQYGVDVYFSPSYALPVLPRVGRLLAAVPLPRRLETLFNSRRKVRYVVTVHDVITAIHPETFTPKMRMWQSLFNRNAAALADRVIVVSESTRRDFIRVYRPSKPSVWVVPHGIDDRFSRVTDPTVLERVRARYSLPASFILYLGTIEPRKNVTGLARAYAQLPPEMRKQYPLVLCGARGWYSDAIFDEIRGLDSADSIRVIGYAAHDDLAGLYSLATLFVYPSLYEGFGYPPLEAMACGVPVITSNVSALPEVVGDAGITVDPRDDDALASEIGAVLSDAHLRDRLAQKSLARAQQFSWETMAAQTLAILESAAAEARIAPSASSPVSSKQ